MSIRPFRDINRKKTKELNVGNLKIGGDNPISVQSMTNTLTKDVKSTIKQIKEIEKEEFAFIGNHSHSHEYLINYDFEYFKSDIENSIKIFQNKYFRFQL